MRAPHMPATTLAEVRASLAAKSQPGPGGCRLWTAARSLSGRRKVYYPALWVGGHVVRVNRLVLLLQEVDPQDPFLPALAAAAARHAGEEAAHRCDRSRCIAEAHLDWRSHAANIAEQRARQAAQAEVAAHLDADEDLAEARTVADQLRA